MATAATCRDCLTGLDDHGGPSGGAPTCPSLVDARRRRGDAAGRCAQVTLLLARKKVGIDEAHCSAGGDRQPASCCDALAGGAGGGVQVPLPTRPDSSALPGHAGPVRRREAAPSEEQATSTVVRTAGRAAEGVCRCGAHSGLRRAGRRWRWQAGVG